MEKRKVAGIPKLWECEWPVTFQCPGCHQPLVERLVCEVLEELGVAGDAIGFSSTGCTAVFVNSVRVDAITIPHGRAPDGASAVKRALFGKPIVFTVQGDGDCISIGAGSLINAAARAEKITVIMENNGVYGTTGGQMGPTTLMGQVTPTSLEGRHPGVGYPIHVPELLSTMKGVAYAARGTVHNPAQFQRTKRYIKTAFQKQIDNVGFSFVEVLVACPPDWHMTPLESLDYIEKDMMAEFPLGEFKNSESID